MATSSTYPTTSSSVPRGPRRGDDRSEAAPPLPSTDATRHALGRLRADRRRRVRRGVGSASLLLLGARTGSRDRAADPRGRSADLRIVRASRDDDDPFHAGDRDRRAGGMDRPGAGGRGRGVRLPAGALALRGGGAGDLPDGPEQDRRRGRRALRGDRLSESARPRSARGVRGNGLPGGGTPVPR